MNENWIDLKVLIEKAPSHILNSLNYAGLEIKHIRLNGKEEFWVLERCFLFSIFGYCISFLNFDGELVEDCQIISSYKQWFVKLSDRELEAC